MPVRIKKLNQNKKMPLPKSKPRHASPKHRMNTEKTKPLGKAVGGTMEMLRQRSMPKPPPPSKGMPRVPKEFMGTRQMESKAADKKRSRRGSAKSVPSTGMAGGGKLKMVEKGGKKVPFFAADGKGKMAMGGMMKKKGMAKGGMMKKGYAKGGPVKVKSGDTLSQIAKKNGLTLASLMAANPGIKNANEIRVGQSIKMPTGGAKSRAQSTAKKKGVYGDTSKPVMKSLADDTAAKRASKAGKPASKVRTAKSPDVANKRAAIATRLSNLGQTNKNNRANDAAAKASRPASDRKVGPSKTAIAKAAKSASTKPATTAENQRLAALRAKARKRVDRRAGGGMMKKKGYAKGGMMKKGMAAGGVMRGTGAAIKGKRFGRSG
jgi:LysM repeat protein